MEYAWDNVMTGIRRNVWLRRRRLAMFGFEKSDRILDLGCGDGLDIRILRQQGIQHITGVDVSPKLLADAKIKNPGVRFVRASADALPFPDGSFDAVLADSMLYHVVGNTGALGEIRRVLKPGGRLCFIEAHESPARRLCDALTFSPVLQCVTYLRRRKTAFTAERKAIERWKTAEQDFLRDLEAASFQKECTKTDFLSIIGQYRKR